MNKGLYIHVPYCRRKCLYCDFYSKSGMPSDEYAAAVVRNIKRYGETFDTVFFGGGTPSLLSPRQVDTILSAADIADGAEITMECNPESSDNDKLSGWRAAGVNRISFGVQSLCDNELKAVGRIHSSSDALRVIASAFSAGYDNVSADVMIGLPCQTMGSLADTVNGLCDGGVTHLSAYMLKIEEGTPMSSDAALLSRCADDDSLADMYEQTVALLEDRGLHQYEISNFAAKGRECAHNLKYWRCDEYIGIGPGAHSQNNGIRYAVPCDTELFISSEYQQEDVVDNEPCTADERMMLALRLTEGYDLSLAGDRADAIMRRALPFEKAGLLKTDGGRLRLTVKGFLMSNEIICRLMD